MKIFTYIPSDLDLDSITKEIEVPQPNLDFIKWMFGMIYLYEGFHYLKNEKNGNEFKESHDFQAYSEQ